MSQVAMESVEEYGLTATAGRFGDLLRNQCNSPGKEVEKGDGGQSKDVFYPYQWDFSEIFHSHPKAFWMDQKVELTRFGEDYLRKPCVLPQFIQASGMVEFQDVRKFLFLVKQGHDIAECLKREVESLAMSIALKNGLVALE